MPRAKNDIPSYLSQVPCLCLTATPTARWDVTDVTYGNIHEKRTATGRARLRRPFRKCLQAPAKALAALISPRPRPQLKDQKGCRSTAGSDFQHVLRYTPSTNSWSQMGVTLPDNQMNNMACGVTTVPPVLLLSTAWAAPQLGKPPPLRAMSFITLPPTW